MHTTMARRCSHCGSYGHNSRTCCVVVTAGHRERDDDAMRCGEGAAGLRLFGVQLHAAAVGANSPAALQLQKCYSTDCLQLQVSPSLASLLSSSPPSLLLSIDEGSDRATDDYLTDGPHGGVPMRERKKGVPWSEEEHRLFLMGLEKLGKGDWRGISRSFVTTRTPTQVASHAQKFFLRQNSVGKKNNKLRSSLFDMVQNCEGGRRTVSDRSNCKATSTSLPLKSMSIDRTRPSSEATFPVITERAHGYGHHCSQLDLELGMSLTPPSIGT